MLIYNIIILNISIYFCIIDISNIYLSMLELMNVINIEFLQSFIQARLLTTLGAPE